MRPFPHSLPWSLALLVGSASAAFCAEVSVTLPVVSAYVARGVLVDPETVLQPSLAVSGAGFTFNLWGNLDLTGYGESAGYGNRSGEFTELDLSLEYGLAWGPAAVAAGVISYLFPGISPSTHELFGRATLDWPAHPSLTAYTDIDESKGSYFSAGLSQPFALGLGPLESCSLALTAGFGSGSCNRCVFGVEKAAAVDLVATFGLQISLPAGLTLCPAYSLTWLPDPDLQATQPRPIFHVGSAALAFAW